MGVVDDGGEVLTRVDDLHAPGHVDPGHRSGEHLGRDPGGAESGPGAERIGGVEAAGQSHLDLERCTGVEQVGVIAEGEGLARGAGDDGRADHVSIMVQGVGDLRDLAVVGEAAPPHAIDADHGAARAGRGEEVRLGGEVVLHGAVEVEVVLAQLGEDRDVVDDPVDATEHERVTGDLHRHGGDTLLAHDGEQGMQVGCLGGGAVVRHIAVADAHAGGADDPGRVTGGAQAGLEQVHRRRLAIRARDADEQQVAGGVAVDLRRNRSERLARIPGEQHRQVSHHLRARIIGEDSDGTE